MTDVATLICNGATYELNSINTNASIQSHAMMFESFLSEIKTKYGMFTDEEAVQWVLDKLDIIHQLQNNAVTTLAGIHSNL